MFNKTQENLIIYSLPSENNSFPTRVNSWNIGYTLVNSYLASKTRTSDVACKFSSDRDFLVNFIRYNFISACAKIMWFSRWDTYEIFTWWVDIASLATVEYLNLSYHFSPLICIFQVILICVQENTRKSHYILVIQRAKLVSGKGQLETSWLQTSQFVTRIKNKYFCFWRGLFGSQR